MDTRRLGYFACILEEGSITAAAQRLRLSQPTLTKSMKLLEDEFGVVLFERSMTGITPTTYGEALYSRAKGILADMRRAQEEIATLRGTAGNHCRIGALPTLMGSIVAKAVEEISRRFPDVTIHVHEGPSQSLIRSLRRRELDVALVYCGNAAGEQGFTSQVLFGDRLEIVASARHPLAGRPSVTVADLAPYPWCVAMSGNWRCVEQMFRFEGLEPQEPRIDPGGAIEFLKSLVGASEYLGIIPQHAVVGELARGELIVLPTDSIFLNREIVAIRPKEVELPTYGRALLSAISRHAPAPRSEKAANDRLHEFTSRDQGTERLFYQR